MSNRRAIKSRRRRRRIFIEYQSL